MLRVPPETDVLLSIQHIAQAYGDKRVLDDFSLELRRGRIACLLGASGCGKTSVLRAIAGFEPLNAGEIHLDGALVSRPGYTLPPEQRRVGMVFQDYSLFPHLSVARNVAFGLPRSARHDHAQRVQELLALVGLAGLGERYPHQLSGGQQQRVALARAMAPRPALLLLDEPFSNLDVSLRERLSLEVREILKREGATAIMVTHDQHEAFAMADEIGVMHDGRIEQWDNAYNLYHRPATRFVAGFVGEGVLVPGEMLSAHEVKLELGRLHSAQALPCWPAAAAGDTDMPRRHEHTAAARLMVDVLVRPDDIVHDDASPLRAEVLHKTFRGAEILYTLRLASGNKVLSLLPSHYNYALGARIGIRIEVDHVAAFSTAHTAP